MNGFAVVDASLEAKWLLEEGNPTWLDLYDQVC